MRAPIVLSAALTAALAVTQVAAAAAPAPLSFAIHVALSGNLQASTTSGRFNAAGALVDNGTETGSGRFSGLGHLKTGDPNALHSDMTLTGDHGTISIALDGLFEQLPAPLVDGAGRWVVTEGTGAYAGLHGRGSFMALADFRAAFAHTGPPTVTFWLDGSAN